MHIVHGIPGIHRDSRPKLKTLSKANRYLAPDQTQTQDTFKGKSLPCSRPDPNSRHFQRQIVTLLQTRPKLKTLSKANRYLAPDQTQTQDTFKGKSLPCSRPDPNSRHFQRQIVTLLQTKPYSRHFQRHDYYLVPESEADRTKLACLLENVRKCNNRVTSVYYIFRCRQAPPTRRKQQKTKKRKKIFCPCTKTPKMPALLRTKNMSTIVATPFEIST
eukprot:sb/3469954/